MLIKETKLRASVFGYSVDILDMKDALNFVLEHLKNSEGLQIVTINPEIITAADKNPKLAEIIKNAELVIPESIGIELALKRAGLKKAKRIAGIEFSEELLALCEKNNFKVAFLGGSKEVCIDMQAELKAKYPKINIVFTKDGYYSDQGLSDIINKLQEVQPHLLLVGLGCPKQDFFINDYKNLLKSTVMIGVGGSFDVWAKKVDRAPVIFRLFGLEWFYRLLTQPGRFSRMFPTLPLFFLRIVFGKRSLYLQK